ncbi:alpha/beta hydrolase fold domain-containing protein [Embleya sp. NBC_00896]|uniref:alpha/beta hydrolase fold domain-containing protein n=1 Tax=Embleya sp. NBC_00896 TaxID=2975961 RepID=UPI00386AC184|nr:alpha/beta hydrolase [Embleya sp. NBC_00896]
MTTLQNHGADVLPPSITIPGREHDVPVRVFRGGPIRHGLLVWAHGGSWHSGSAAAWAPALTDLAAIASATVLAVDYRLAPEHPHPAALIDFLTVMDRAREQAGDVPISVGGDSAGATIAASAALAWRDRGHPLTAQVLAYPPLDPTCGAASYRRHPGAFPGRAALAAAWRGYRGVEAIHPAAAADTSGAGTGRLYSTPHESHDLTGVAPAILAVGALDPVADDVRAYADRLRSAGVAVDLHEVAGIGHGAFLSDPAFRHRLGTAYAATHPTAPAPHPSGTDIPTHHAPPRRTS